MGPENAYLNATIHTVDPIDSVAEAILVRDEMIVAIGTNRHVLKHANPACQVFDASGMTIVPGFIDPHNHLSHTMLEAASINCS